MTRRFVRKLTGGVVRWGRSRSWRRLALAAPALLAAALAAGMAGKAAWEPRAARADFYSHLSREARQAGDHRLGVRWGEAAVRIDPSRERRMELAEACLAGGDPDRAIAILRTLAPNDRVGHPPAHLALARLLLARPVTPAVAAEAERHLRVIANREAEGEPATLLLGDYYLAVGQPAKAADALSQTAPRTPARVRYAVASAQAGNAHVARWEAAECAEALAARVRANPADPAPRLLLAQCKMLLGEYPAAVAALDPVARTEAGRGPLTAARGEVYAGWLAALARDPAVTPERRFEALEQALSAHPTDPRLLLVLSTFTDAAAPHVDKTRALLRAELAAGRNVALAHFILGNLALQGGDPQEAEMHLERAYQDRSFGHAAANNLAWLLATTAPGPTPSIAAAGGGAAAWAAASRAVPRRLERALQLVDEAVRQVPANPAFRHTRGLVLVRLGRWKEALPDLEGSLGSLSPQSKTATHAALAEVYTRLGDANMAAVHREQATPAK